MTAPFVAFTVLIIVCILVPLFAPQRAKRYARQVGAAEAHAMSAPFGNINYAGNPYRIGSYVYVMENTDPSDLDWQGTFIGMSNGMAMVRDQETHVVAHVNRDQLYSAQR